MVEVGDKFTLWVESYSEQAYTDQFGKYHGGYIVSREIIVTVTDVRHNVLDMWTEEHIHQGWKAVAEDDKIYKCNWDVFPSDSMSPAYYWAPVAFNKDGTWEVLYRQGSDNKFVCSVVDSVQAYNMRFVFVRKDGTRAVPTGEHVAICAEHDYAYYTRGSCFYCRIEESKRDSK